MTALSIPPDSFRAVFRTLAGASQTMPFDRFMELALYHPEFGYYRSHRTRIGFGKGSDFFTAASSAPVFGELIAASCSKLLSPRASGEYTFVEIGSESAGGVLAGVDHPFKNARTCRLGEPVELTGKCVVFSNELFDAQPFKRFVGRAGQWRELSVSLHEERFVEVELAAERAPSVLPAEAPEGYIIDAPLAAAALADTISAQRWSGLFVACDYGKSWRELIEACPAGTARAYSRHTQSNDLLAHPGEQDLTCHICWDWVVEALERHGFETPSLLSQESFFVRHAAEYLAATALNEAQRFSSRKASLMQLLHPAHLGQKFQILHALRD